ncbi:MAG: metalloregulator ArsR/SmtB family transcription factor [Solirubrobacteraceae bacterium]
MTVALKDEIPALSGDLFDLVARRMQAIGEPTRMRIVTLLRNCEATVQELTDRLSTGAAPLTQQNVSKHLGILYQAGILARQRDGRCVRYTVSDFTVCQLLDHAVASTAGHFDELADIARPPC